MSWKDLKIHHYILGIVAIIKIIYSAPDLCICPYPRRKICFHQAYSMFSTADPKRRWPWRPIGWGTSLSSFTSSSIISSGLSRCLACSQSPNQIHFICNQLEPLALMEEIRARSKNYKPTTPDQPTVTWTRRRRQGRGDAGERGRVTAVMKGWKMEIWRPAESPRGETWESRVLGETARRLRCYTAASQGSPPLHTHTHTLFFSGFHQVGIGCLKSNAVTVRLQYEIIKMGSEFQLQCEKKVNDFNATLLNCLTPRQLTEH